jgi:hypothetical protein
MAPQTGIEPMTDRLTADCSTAELLRNMLLYSQQHYLSTEILVSVARIELALHAPKARVIPFHYTEKNWLHLLGSNQPLPVNSRGYSPRILRWNTKHGRGYWIRTSDHGVKVRCFRPSKLTPNKNWHPPKDSNPDFTALEADVLPLHQRDTVWYPHKVTILGLTLIKRVLYL